MISSIRSSSESVVSSLVHECRDGNHDNVAAIVSELKQQGRLEGINELSASGTTALITAASFGHTEIVDLLIKEGAALNLQRKGGLKAALHVASLNGHEDVVQKLAERGAHIEITCQDGLTPLMCACKQGYYNIAKFLLAKGANPNAHCEKNGKTALYYASRHNNLELLQLLFEWGAHIDESTHLTDSKKVLSLLVAACKVGECKPHVLQMLVLKGAKVQCCTADGRIPLVLAIQAGHIECVRVLLCGKSPVNTCQLVTGLTPLHFAAKLGHSDIIKELLRAGARKDIRDAAQFRPVDYAEDTLSKSLLTPSFFDIPGGISLSPLTITTCSLLSVALCTGVILWKVKRKS